MQELCNLLTNFALCFDRAHKEKRLSIQNRQHNSFQGRVVGVVVVGGWEQTGPCPELRPVSHQACTEPAEGCRAWDRLTPLKLSANRTTSVPRLFFFVFSFFFLVKLGKFFWEGGGVRNFVAKSSICILLTGLNCSPALEDCCTVVLIVNPHTGEEILVHFQQTGIKFSCDGSKREQKLNPHTYSKFKKKKKVLFTLIHVVCLSLMLRSEHTRFCCRVCYYNQRALKVCPSWASAEM